MAVVVVVVVVRHRKTLDSAAHEYAKRIASSRAKVIFFFLSLFFLPFFFSLAASTPTAQAIVQEIRATLPASLSRNISRPLFICFPFTCDTLSVTGIAEFHPPVIEENFSLFRRESHLFFLNCPLEERITLPCNFSILLSRAHTMMRAFAYPSFAKNQISREASADIPNYMWIVYVYVDKFKARGRVFPTAFRIKLEEAEKKRKRRWFVLFFILEKKKIEFQSHSSLKPTFPLFFILCPPICFRRVEKLYRRRGI